MSVSYPDDSVQRRLGRTISERVDQLSDASPGLDGVAAAVKAAIAPVAGDRAPQGVRDALLGSALGHPMHPFIVTLPIGAWSLASLFDLMGERRAADLCLRTGVLAAGAAAITGLAQWNEVTDRERPRRIGVMHSSLNTVASGIYICSWVLRSRGQRGAGVATAAAGLAVTSLSGWLGGHLSYTLGVGVEDDALVRQHAASQPVVDEDAAEAQPVPGLDPLSQPDQPLDPLAR